MEKLNMHCDEVSKKEKEMLYNACLAYANQLSDIAKKITEADLAHQISVKGSEYYELAQKLQLEKNLR